MTAAAEVATGLLSIALEDLHESPHNPRKHFDPAKLAELAESLKKGQLAPVLVRERNTAGGPGVDYEIIDGYELAAGHRRFRAAQLAGLTHLLAIVRPMTDAEFLEIVTIENLQREDVSALEEAAGFKALQQQGSYDVPTIAEKIGKSKEYVYGRLKLLELIPAAKQLLMDGTLTPGHGVLLARLSKADQQRALDESDRGGGALQREHVSEQYFAGETGLEEHDPKKPRSVRELKQWIDREVRFVPETLDRRDVAFDLPATAELLDTAAKNKLKVVKVTREYRVPDAARDENERTYGVDHWKRADGEPEPFDRYGTTSDATPSLVCDRSVVGLVAAGPGRGEAFHVCIAKEKCTVHWAAEMKERAKRAAAREREAARPSGNGTAPKAKALDPNVLPDDLRETWEREALTVCRPEIVRQIKAVIGELKISEEICWNLTCDLYLYSWNNVGKHNHAFGRTWRHENEIHQLLVGQLPGRFEGKTLEGADGPGARSELAWHIWRARDYGDLDQSIEKAVSARWAAHRKATTKELKAVQSSAKPAKKRAGDVAKKKAVR